MLAILDEGESYGYAILKRIDELSGGELEWTEGMLYPLLHRLDRLGYVESRWDSSQGGRRRKYYGITPEGRNALSEQRRQWEVRSRTPGVPSRSRTPRPARPKGNLDGFSARTRHRGSN